MTEAAKQILNEARRLGSVDLAELIKRLNEEVTRRILLVEKGLRH